MCLKVVNPVDAESNHLQPKTAFSPEGDSLPNRQGWSSEIYNRPFHISFQLLIKTRKFTKVRDDMSRVSEDFAPQRLVILQTLVWVQKLSHYHNTNVCIAFLQALHLWQAKWVAGEPMSKWQSCKGRRKWTFMGDRCITGVLV